MKGIICYYSGSGNTKLAISYINKQIPSCEFELFNIMNNETPDFSKFNIVGFATFADFWSAPQLMHTFFNGIEQQKGKPAFVFNTYGFISGKTLKSLSDLAKNKGFNVISGCSLHTPENFPPMRKRNMAFDHAPKPKEFEQFNKFIDFLSDQISSIIAGDTPRSVPIKTGIMGIIFPKFSRKQSKKDFGIQNVKNDICTECGKCKKVCPYDAIKLSPKPVFDHEKCFGCWACYNHCPSQAIFTPKFNGNYQYPKPINELVEKLK
jgi:ferredoxin/flavodoxin